MKQRIVIRVPMADLKSRTKAMKIAVGVSGVEVAAITGPEKNQVEVIGDRIDAVFLTKLIRKKVAYAEIVSVGEAKKEEAAAEKPPPETAEPALPQVFWSPVPAASYYDRYRNDYPYAHHDLRDDYSCSIL